MYKNKYKINIKDFDTVKIYTELFIDNIKSELDFFENTETIYYQCIKNLEKRKILKNKFLEDLEIKKFKNNNIKIKNSKVKKIHSLLENHRNLIEQVNDTFSLFENDDDNIFIKNKKRRKELTQYFLKNINLDLYDF